MADQRQGGHKRGNHKRPETKSQERNRPEPEGMAPRRAALALIQGVTAEGKLMPELLADGVLARLVPEDRARAQRLAMETLRQMDRADGMLKPFLQRPPPLMVRNVLRLGTIEIVQGAAAHGVVNAMVDIVGRGKRTVSFKGLVNAVLRRVDAGRDGWDKLPVSRLPGWLRAPLVAAWGREAVVAMEAVQALPPPLDLSLKLGASVEGEVLPTGSVRIVGAGQVTGLPGFEAGDWWVQDAAAALPVRMLRLEEGQRALDLCAAPGGKTLQMAAAGADVTALDISEARMGRVRENLARTGLTAEVVIGDALTFAGTFDAVLLDAPCSATGTLRRHPDLPWAKDGSEFAALIEAQSAMIDHALTLLRPGGRLVYCTCSLLPDEGEVQVEEALARHPGLKVDATACDLPGVEPGWHSPEGGLRLRPDYWAERGGMDGFYMACLIAP